MLIAADTLLSFLICADGEGRNLFYIVFLYKLESLK